MARIEQISSLSNPKVKGIAALAQKKARVESGQFVVEGLQLVGFGVERGWELDMLVFKDGQRYQHGGQAVYDTALQATKQAFAVTGAVLEKLVRKDNPQGVIGVFKQKTMPLAEVELNTDVWVVLEEVRDPGNLGTIIRTADAVGAKGVIMVGNSTDVWAPEVLRATMGSIFHAPVVLTSREAFLAWKAGQDAVMVGTHLRGDCDYREVADKVQNKAVLLAMGTEQSGLSDEMADACDVLTKIAMRGGAESLNLAIATGVMLYEIFRSIK
ncbi:MAG: RNA methyltransferase [Alphaproteobacteria bacterium]|nr:MAG: RNA methyltransferase [Alphaproteobacteria bacterium]